jgi:hypothetical protein
MGLVELRPNGVLEWTFLAFPRTIMPRHLPIGGDSRSELIDVFSSWAPGFMTRPVNTFGRDSMKDGGLLTPKLARMPPPRRSDSFLSSPSHLPVPVRAKDRRSSRPNRLDLSSLDGEVIHTRIGGCSNASNDSSTLNSTGFTK